MRLTSLKLNDFRDLYLQQLKELYYTENQIIDALPKMIDAATSTQLQSAFRQHLEQTRSQRQRLERIFRRLNVEPEEEKSNAAAGLIDDGSDMIKAEGDPAVRDAGLIAVAQRIEHYEIAGYGCARTFAQRLGFHEDASVLQQILDEEGQTDKTLTQLAERHINVEAQQSVPR
ncbi:MAG TPA: ferritin-like domain-containing protein [Acidobacteriota bacterium]|nr:ferritin-like domain-containing protein [Acidobacteriota bacterium]